MDILVIASLILLLGVLAAWMLPRLACPWREQVALRKLAEQLGFRYYGRRRLGIPRSGRATGRLRDRACTIETFKQMGVDPYTRVIISVDNPHGCRFRTVLRRIWQMQCSRCVTSLVGRPSSRGRCGRTGIASR
jgi:hypothetical protein